MYTCTDIKTNVSTHFSNVGIYCTANPVTKYIQETSKWKI